MASHSTATAQGYREVLRPRKSRALAVRATIGLMLATVFGAGL